MSLVIESSAGDFFGYSPYEFNIFKTTLQKMRVILCFFKSKPEIHRQQLIHISVHYSFYENQSFSIGNLSFSICVSILIWNLYG